MSWRGSAALRLLRWSYRLEEAAAALVDQRTLRGINRDSYPSEASDWIDAASRGLEAGERALVDRLGFHGGKVLCLASGGGREAFALSRLGCNVVGVEQVAEMVEASRARAAQDGLSTRFVRADMTRFETDEFFDFVMVMNLAYSLVPGRRDRVAFLERCRRLLAPGGRCVLSFSVKTPTPAEARWFPATKTLARLAGNPAYEIGDRVDATPIYIRFFPSEQVVGDEAADAGFASVEYFNPVGNDHFAILAP